MINQFGKSRLKKLSLLSIFLKVSVVMLFFSYLTCVASERTDYRCFVELQDKSLGVHQFVTNERSESEFLNKLPGSMVYFSDGISGSKIVNVKECIKKGQTFESKEARELVKITPV